MKTVGERHMSAGPILVASKKLHDRWLNKFTAADARPLKKLKESAGIAKVAGEDVVFLRGSQTGIVPWGDRAAVLVFCNETSGYLLPKDRAKALDALDPLHLPAKAWKLIGEVALDGKAVMFDAIAGYPDGRDERKQRLELGLPKGRYVVEVASGEVYVKPSGKVVEVKYRHVRLRPTDWAAPKTGAAKPAVVDDGPVIASRELIAAARKLKCASNDQVPMVIAPRRLVASWTGIAGADYDRACKVRGVGEIQIGDRKGLVVAEPGGVMFWPTETGGLIVIWLGAHSLSGCIAAATSIPDGEWEKQKAALVVEKGDEEWLIFDSAAPGKTLNPNGTIGERDFEVPTAPFRLAAGRYRIDACWSWETRVKVGKNVEDTMIGALRLTRA